MRDENGRYAVSISDKSGTVLMTARRGGTNPIQYTISSDKMVYFSVMGTPTDGPQQVTVDLNTAYTIENTLTNTPVEKITSALPHVYNLSSGFYRILPNVGSGAVKVSYT
ncbi:MAG: hypothetical protein ACK56I_35220, partial [bacterium]